jgi:hypothetical protein
MEHDEEYQEMKKEYLSFKYNLPNFEKLEEDFDLDKISDRNKKFVLLNIRRVMIEKFTNYSQLFEALLNPVSQSRLLLHMLKKIDEEKKIQMKKFCDILIDYQFEAIKLELIYDEKREAKFIISAFEKWENIKKEILEMLDSIDFKAKDSKNNHENNYFS